MQSDYRFQPDPVHEYFRVTAPIEYMVTEDGNTFPHSTEFALILPGNSGAPEGVDGFAVPPYDNYVRTDGPTFNTLEVIVRALEAQQLTVTVEHIRRPDPVAPEVVTV